MENENWAKEISESYQKNAKEYYAQRELQINEQKTEIYQKKFLSLANSVKCYLDEELSRTFGFGLSDLNKEEAGKIWEQIQTFIQE
jgi:hypothetical protein